MFLRTLPHPPAASAPPLVRWDDTPCPLCGRRDEELVMEAPDPHPSPGRDGPALRFAVVRCRRCGLTYTNPRPDEADIARFYPSDYRPHRRPRKMQQVRPRPWLAWLFGRPCPERRGLPWQGRGRLLDFGCGGGAFLKRMADQGWDVTGLDTSEETTDRVQRDLGLPALTGSLPHPGLRPGSFDVVTMWHSIEHVHRPLEVLREAFQLLVPGGRLVVACPNIESWPAAWFGPAWFGLDLPRHLTHFTPGSLSEMLTAAGFRVDVVKPIRHSDWLRSSAKLAVRQGVGGVAAKALTWKPAAKAAALAAYLAGGSDCMMAVAARPTVG